MGMSTVPAAPEVHSCIPPATLKSRRPIASPSDLLFEEAAILWQTPPRDRTVDDTRR